LSSTIRELLSSAGGFKFVVGCSILVLIVVRASLVVILIFGCVWGPISSAIRQPLLCTSGFEFLSASLCIRRAVQSAL
jgi:hypothetical protein